LFLSTPSTTLYSRASEKHPCFLEDKGGRLKIRDSLAGRPYKTHCGKDQPSIMEEQAAEKRFST